jgi:hypothetical protein
MDQLQQAARLRHYGIEMLKLAADIEAQHRYRAVPLPIYQPRFEVVDGVEAITNRFACCGAGVDQRDDYTLERLHLPGCPKIAAEGLAACHAALRPLGWTASDERDEAVDAGVFDEVG